MIEKTGRWKKLLWGRKANRQYKDLLFRYVFKDKKSLLMLYNALNGSDHTDEEELEITTIENAVYMVYKNDVSFLLSNTLVLYEHQSTFNPNMPVRGLIYFADRYEEYIQKNKLNIYGSKLVELPAPQYIIFYNGTEEEADYRKLRLSDAFGRQGNTPALEVEATMLNINYGHNMELLNQCKPLMDYARFIEQVRIYQKKTKTLEQAIHSAISYCISHDIMAEILKENRLGVERMLLTEFDMKQYVKFEHEEGKQEGRQEGRQEGEERLAGLIQVLIRDDRREDIEKVVSDSQYREKLYLEYELKH